MDNMSEIKISLQNKSNKTIQGLYELPNKIAAKVSTVSFDEFNLKVESISIVIDATDNELSNAVALKEKNIYFSKMFPKTL